MKKMILTMVALLSMTVAVAQDSDQKRGKAPKEMTAEEMTNRMAEQLSLTDAQKAQMLQLNTEYKDVIGRPGGMRGMRGMRGGMRGQRPDGNTSASEQQQQRPERPQLTDEQKAQMKERMAKRQEYDKKVKEVLTDDQYKTWQKQQRRGPRQMRGNKKNNEKES